MLPLKRPGLVATRGAFCTLHRPHICLSDADGSLKTDKFTDKFLPPGGGPPHLTCLSRFHHRHRGTTQLH